MPTGCRGHPHGSIENDTPRSVRIRLACRDQALNHRCEHGIARTHRVDHVTGQVSDRTPHDFTAATHESTVATRSSDDVRHSSVGKPRDELIKASAIQNPCIIVADLDEFAEPGDHFKALHEPFTRVQHARSWIGVDDQASSIVGNGCCQLINLVEIVKWKTADESVGRLVDGLLRLGAEVDGSLLRRVVEYVARLPCPTVADCPRGAVRPNCAHKAHTVLVEKLGNSRAVGIVADHGDERCLHSEPSKTDCNVERRTTHEVAGARGVTKFIDQRVTDHGDGGRRGAHIGQCTRLRKLVLNTVRSSMAGIEEVAQKAGVSTATVSRALSGRGYVSERTRNIVQSAASELGYVVSSTASGLASGRTRNIGVVVPLLSHWYFANVVEGAETALLRRGYDTTLYNLTGGEAERRSVFTHFLLRKRVDAVIAINLELTADEVSALHDLRKPLVGIGGPIPDVPTLELDDFQVAKLATSHLTSLEHRRIAHIGGGREFDVDFHLPTTRRRGYESALADAGIAIDDALVRTADFTMKGGYVAAKQLLGSPANRPTGIFAASDDMAIGAILAARDLGLSVPNDVSVVGVDDNQQAPFFDLTTVAQFPKRQGETAVDLLLAELGESIAKPTELTLPFELVVRGSTSRPQD